MSAEKIRALNDAFRTTMTGGKVLMTAGVNALPSDVQAMVIRRVATFSEFNAENDPHGEHDFGSFRSRVASSFSKSIITTRTWSSVGRPGRSGENNPRADDHARERVLIPARRARGLCFRGYTICMR